MVDLRLRTDYVLREIRRGRALRLTYRGQPLADILPAMVDRDAAEDPAVYRLAEQAESGMGSLTNAEIDRVVYE